LWSKDSKTKTLPITDLKLSMQVRLLGTQGEHVETVKFQISNHEAMEPVDVFLLDGDHILVDGYHRLEAYRALGHDSVLASVYEGHTKEDAETFAFLANINKGLKSSPSDQELAVENILNSKAGKEHFCSGHSVDIQKLHDFIGIPKRTLERATKRIRNQLTRQRDQQILALKNEGATRKGIAQEVGVSEKTVSRITNAEISTAGQSRQVADVSSKPLTEYRPPKAKHSWTKETAYQALQVFQIWSHGYATSNGPECWDELAEYLSQQPFDEELGATMGELDLVMTSKYMNDLIDAMKRRYAQHRNNEDRAELIGQE